MNRILSTALLGLLIGIGCKTAGLEDNPSTDDTGMTQCVDEDEDGFCAEDDCDDRDASVRPNANEICDQIDNDCDGEVDEGNVCGVPPVDRDGDGYDSTSDCDDEDASVYPGAVEDCTDGIDNDCDDLVDDEDPDCATDVTDPRDADDDGYNAVAYGGDDCDDNNPAVNPDAEETCNELDDDCDGVVDNGYGLDCDSDGFPWDAGDCDDTNINDNPDAIESCGDGRDNDCDGDIDCSDDVCAEAAACTGIVDNDGDGWPSDLDCNDSDPNVHPGAVEQFDGTDNDCDGRTDCDDAGDLVCDGDGDGHLAEAYGGDDCDDTTGTINPSATEIYDNGADDDCNPRTADDGDWDNDGHDSIDADGDDCDDHDSTIYPGAEETCNGADDDCDEEIDEWCEYGGEEPEDTDTGSYSEDTGYEADADSDADSDSDTDSDFDADADSDVTGLYMQIEDHDSWIEEDMWCAADDRVLVGNWVGVSCGWNDGLSVTEAQASANIQLLVDSVDDGNNWWNFYETLTSEPVITTLNTIEIMDGPICLVWFDEDGDGSLDCEKYMFFLSYDY